MQNMTLLSFVIILFNISLANAANLNENRLRFYLGGGYGYQWLKTDIDNEISKNGSLFDGFLIGEYALGVFGIFGVGGGIQSATQVGTSSTKKQTITVVNPIVDFTWHHTFIPRALEIGAVARNFFGVGSLFDYSDSTATQWLITAGPELRYRFAPSQNTDVLVSLGVYSSLNTPNRTILQIPLQVTFSLFRL